jgi:hypothetical protein
MIRMTTDASIKKTAGTTEGTTTGATTQPATGQSER